MNGDSANDPNKPPFSLDGINNIAIGLTKLENSFTNNDLQDQKDRALLYLIYDYLSTALSNYDNDITVETIHEAIDKNSSKYANFNYAFGAVYVLALTIMLHAYMTSMGNDNFAARKGLLKYSYILSYSADSINKIIKDSSNKDHMKMVNVFDSVAYVDSCAIKKSLSANIRWIHNQVSLYPVTGRLRDGVEYAMFSNNVDTLDNHQLLYLSNEWIYLSEQLVDDFRKYILPMLYGLIGSFLWVIRKMSDQVKSYDLTWKKLIRHRARLIMGLFVGMFFGYLFKSNEISSTYSITPFVAAFVGGYQVEILFTLMDKIIAAFSTTESNGKGKTIPQAKTS